MFVTLILTLLLIMKGFLCIDVYDIEDDNAHGVRISGNDQFVVYAINRFGGFVINYAPFTPLQTCGYWNTNTDLFVYSLSVIFNNDSSTSNQLYTFIQIAEQMSSQDIYISIITLNISNCVNEVATNISISDTLIFSGIHQEYMLLKVAPSQNYAYVFADSFILSFDIVNNRMIELTSFNLVWPYSVTIVPHAIDLTDKWAVIASFVVLPGNTEISIPIAFLCELQPLNCIDYVVLFDDYTQKTSLAITYNRANDLSVSVNNQRQMAIIGFAQRDITVLLTINATSTKSSQWKINPKRVDIGPQRNIGFGRSVAWIDNTTIAIGVLKVNERPWSQSEVWIFSVDKPLKTPLFIFPNNQQILALSSTTLFLQILSWSNNLYILTDNFRALLVPSSPPGYHSVWYNSGDSLIYIFESIPCIAGTYKKELGFGLCTVCPPDTKNTAQEPCSECSSCSLNSFCPLGSVDDISLDNYSSYTQTFAYPDSPDMNNYDDILVQNIFTIGRSVRCLIIAPLFWTSLTIICCFIIWLIMTIGKVYQWKIINRHREKAKHFLKMTDIVGEGERWVGGLLSFAILVLFGFTVWFAANYLHLYPIETSKIVHASCDDTIHNAVFDNGLQLSLPTTDGTRWVIFDMLEKQPFTMTIDLINTRADCSNITIQQNRPGVNYLIIPILSCIIQPDNFTISLTFSIPAHQLSVQLNITGPYFIGGIRVCFHGPGRIDGVNTLQTLDMCQFLSTINETLARISTISIVLIKVVNQTKPLRVGDATLYSGRWAPTFVENTLSDKLIYEQDGDYIRYINQRTTLTITLSEQSFFLQNNQKPIVRVAELSFHTLLFCTLIIELFAITFILFKLLFMPFIHLIDRCRHCRKHNINMMTDPQSLSLYTISTDINNYNSKSRRKEMKKRRSSLSLSNLEVRHLFRNYEGRKQQHSKKNIFHKRNHDQIVVEMSDE